MPTLLSPLTAEAERARSAAPSDADRARTVEASAQFSELCDDQCPYCNGPETD